MGKVEKASIAVAVIAIIIAAIAIYYASSVTSEASGLRGLVTDLSRKVDSLSGQVSTLSSKVSELEKALGAMAPPKPPLEELLKGLLSGSECACHSRGPWRPSGSPGYGAPASD